MMLDALLFGRAERVDPRALRLNEQGNGAMNVDRCCLPDCALDITR